MYILTLKAAVTHCSSHRIMSPDSISLYVDICICTCSLFLRKNFAAGVYTLRPGLTHSINQVFISVTRPSIFVHVSDMYFCISVNVFVCRFSSISLPSLWCTLCGRVWLTGSHRVFTAWRHQTRDTATEAPLKNTTTFCNNLLSGFPPKYSRQFA